MPVTAQSIAINALSHAIGGGVAVARSLTAAIARERPTAELILLCSNPEVARGPYPANVRTFLHPTLGAFLLRTAWEQTRLPSVLEKIGAEILLNLGGFSVFSTGIPQISVWQNPNIYTRLNVRRSAAIRLQIILQRRAQALSMRKSTLNVFLSDEGVRECTTRWPMHQISHRVIHHGIELESSAEEATACFEFDRPFVLAIGHSYFHKNYEALIDAMDRYRTEHGDGLMLVIAGGAVYDSYHRTLLDDIAKRNLAETVRFLGPTSKGQIMGLCRRAKVYVTTSLLESFGLTPLEAMSQGLPALVSNTSCLPEICADAALYCDPRDPADIARKLHTLCSDDDLREMLRTRGFERAKSFTWERCARGYLAATDDCLRA